MVKLSARQIRSMRRDLLKTTLATKKTHTVVEELAHQLTVQKNTNSILRTSLQNFSGPLYKLERRYNKLARAYKRKSNENDHLKRAPCAYERKSNENDHLKRALRKRRKRKTI